MANKIMWIIVSLFAAFLVMGCIGAADETKETTDDSAEEKVGAGEPIVPVEEDLPRYNTPLDQTKFTRTCSGKEDVCKLVLTQTGSGPNQICVQEDSEYEGEVSGTCICKFTGSVTYDLPNGTLFNQDNYECRAVI